MRLLAALLLVVVMLGAGTALVSAHSLLSTMTTVKYNAASGMLEVEHRTSAHDAEHAFGAGLLRMGGIESLRGRAWLALQLSNQFELWHSGVAELPLEVVGAELDAEFLYVYEQASVSSFPDQLTVRNDILMAQEEGQINYLNIYFPDMIRSLTFAEGSSIQVVSAADP